MLDVRNIGATVPLEFLQQLVSVVHPILLNPIINKIPMNMVKMPVMTKIVLFPTGHFIDADHFKEIGIAIDTNTEMGQPDWKANRFNPSPRSKLIPGKQSFFNIGRNGEYTVDIFIKDAKSSIASTRSLS